MQSHEILVSGNENRARKFIDGARGRDCCFVCVISYTKTCEIPGITLAGANPDLIQFTPSADAEFLYHGECKCISRIPATPDGKPTPALITRAALKTANIPLVVVDAGSKIKPNIPCTTLEIPIGENIASGHALNIELVKKAFDKGIKIGSELGDSVNNVIIGESIPAGTTTALGVLLAMGVDARFKVSSSMPDNPHELKLATVQHGMNSASITFGNFANEPLEAIAHLGDPMIPTVASIALGASKKSNVMLAGGTQMAAVLSVINTIDKNAVKNLVIGTTRYILNDNSSDIRQLVNSIGDVPILSCDPNLSKSNKEGLRAYAYGFVKEGVGAGGACISAILKSDGVIDGNKLLLEIEKEYERVI